MPAAESAPRRRTHLTVEETPLSGSVWYVQAKRQAVHTQALGNVFKDAWASLADLYDHNIALLKDSMAALYGLGARPPQTSEPAQVRSPTVTDFFLKWWADRETTLSEGEWASSKTVAHYMIQLGSLPSMPGDQAVNTQLNNGLFTHNPDGSLNDILPDDIRRRFAGDANQWPNLILTSSHALVRDHKDVSGIMQGWHSLITDTFRKDHVRHPKLDLLRTPWESVVEEPSSAEPSKSTLIVSSVYNEHNAWVNGGNLLLRLAQLDDMHDKTRDDYPTPEAFETAYLKHISPAAIRLGKLMLHLIVREPAADMVPDVDPNEEPREYLTQGQQIALRDNAADILAHIKPMGYSKGGNIVSDAVRFLALELERPGVFRLPDVENQHDPAQRRRAVARLIHPMGVLCVNPGICPLSTREKQLGMRRVTFRNKFDKITSHLFSKHHARFGERDDIYVAEGKKDELGHAIPDALGGQLNGQDIPGYLTNAKHYTPANGTSRFDDVRSRLQTYFAACIDAVGISHVHYDAATDRQHATIEFSGGVTPALIEANKHIIEGALQKNGFGSATIATQPDANGNYQLRLNPPRTSKTPLREMLCNALTELQDNKHNHVFVSQQAIHRLQEPELQRQMGA